VSTLSKSLEIWYTERWCKGATWYQVWLECNKHSQVIRDYSRKQHQYVVTPTGQTANGKKLKIGTEVGQLSNFNLLWFERN